MRKFWTDEEKEILIKAYKEQRPLKEVAEELNRDYKAVKKMGQKLGLKYKDYKIDDVLGKKFGRLTPIKKTDKKGHEGYVYECKCDCGNSDVVLVPRSRLVNRITKSCGCIRRENTSKMFKRNNTFDLSGEYGIGYTTKGQEFYFDLEDYDKIKDYCWFKNPDGYIMTNISGTRKSLGMHNLVMGIKDKNVIPDHIHGELTRNDNRKINLRLATKGENNTNKGLQSNNTSGVTGVYWDKKYNKWFAAIGFKNKNKRLGTFDNKEDAIKVRKAAEKIYHGEYAYDYSQNLPTD